MGARKAKPRRQFDAIDEEPESSKSSKTEDDSFLKTRVVVKKRGRPAKATLEHVATTEGPASNRAMKRRGSAKTAVHEGHDVRDPAMGATLVIRNASALDSAAPKASNAAGNKRGRPRKKLVHDAIVSLAEPIDSFTESKSNQRPKRQAAATARTRVIEGLKEEDSDITKKRREVHSAHTTRDSMSDERQAKRKQELPISRNAGKLQEAEHTVISHTENEGSLETAAGDLKQHGRAVADSEMTLAPNVSGRPRRNAALAASAKVLSGFAEEATDITKRRRDFSPVSRKKRKREIPVNSKPSTVNTLTTTGKADAVRDRPAVPRKRSQATDGTSDSTPTLLDMRRPLAETNSNICPIPQEMMTSDGLQVPGKADVQASIRTETQVASKVSRKAKRQARNPDVSRDAFADPAGSPGNRVEQTEALPLPQEPVLKTKVVAAESRMRTRKSAQAASISPISAPRDEKRRVKPSKIKASRSKLTLGPAATQTAATDGERTENMDWLAQKPEPTKSIRAPTAPRTRKAVLCLPDMDLDDLLSNVANFVSRLG